MKLEHLLAAAMAMSCCHATFATPTYYAFSGVIDTNHTQYAALGAFSGIISFDSSQPDLAPADPHEGYYPMGGSSAMSVTFGNGPQWLTDPQAGYTFSVHLPLDAESEQATDHAHFDIEGHVSNQVDRFMGLSFLKDFVTDALPGATSALHLADFDQVQFFYDGLAEIAPDADDPPIVPYGARGHLTALSCIDGCVDVGPAPNAVPEPSTVALLFAGLAFIGKRRGRLSGQITDRDRRSATCAAS